MENIKRIKELVAELNAARNAYYNSADLVMSDYDYDQKFDELEKLEKETGMQLANSPTVTVGYTVLDELEKVEHEYPMLSLGKTKEVDDVIKFVGEESWCAMSKLDGISLCLTYEGGKLVRAETRGDGKIGSDVTHNVKMFTNVPTEISLRTKLVLFGEAIIDYTTFYEINKDLPEDKKFKNPRNLVAGSLNLLDSSICEQRKCKFIVWRVVEGLGAVNFDDQFKQIEKLGFDVVIYRNFDNNRKLAMSQSMQEVLGEIKMESHRANVPIDGVVISFENSEYMLSLGATSHHLRGQLAFKFGEDKELTNLKEIEWNVSRTGQLNPVAIFDTIELAGTNVSRASLHNLSFIEKILGRPFIGQKLTVSKRNEIIPHIESADFATSEDEEFIEIPAACPICGEKTEVVQENDAKVLFCTNPHCKSKLLGKLELAVSKDALDIKGLSRRQLKDFVELGWLKDISDIYRLKEYTNIIAGMEGYGKKRLGNLLDSIEDSKYIDLAHFIRALAIDSIGKVQSQAIAYYVGGDINKFIECINEETDFSVIDGIGEKMSKSINDWFEDTDNYWLFEDLVNIMEFKNDAVEKADTLSGNTYVITGSLHVFKNRSELKKFIENAGGKVAGSVSKKTTALICNDSSNSEKSKKAKELGIKIITEEEVVELCKK